MNGLGSLPTLERQYVAQVSRQVLRAADSGPVDLDQIAASAGELLRIDSGKAQQLRDKLLGSWAHPEDEARRFDAELRTLDACRQHGLSEPELLVRLAKLEPAVAQAPAGRPDDADAQLEGCFTGAGWEDSFVRLSRHFAGIERDLAHAREYCNPGGEAMVRRLAKLAGIDAETAKRDPPLRVLNLCSGEGGEARLLAQMGCEVDAVDISDLGCAVAQRLNEEKGLDGRINVICGDIATVPLEESKYDVVLFPDGDGFHYQQDRNLLFERLAHVAKDGALLAGSFYIPGRGTPDALKEKFDQDMTWGGFTPKDVNLDTYDAGLQRVGFLPLEKTGEGLGTLVREEVDGQNVADVYRDWHEQVKANQLADNFTDPWLDAWLEGAKEAPNGFGGILFGQLRKDAAAASS